MSTGTLHTESSSNTRKSVAFRVGPVSSPRAPLPGTDGITPLFEVAPGEEPGIGVDTEPGYTKGVLYGHVGSTLVKQVTYFVTEPPSSDTYGALLKAAPRPL